MSFFYGDVKTDELKTANGLELQGGANNNFSLTLDTHPGLNTNYTLNFPTAIGSADQYLKITDINGSTANLGFATVSGGSSTVTLSNITAGNTTSNLNTSAGSIIIYPHVGDIELRANSNVKVFPTTQASSTITGALVVNGGVGIAKNTYVGGNLSITDDVTASSNVNVTGNVVVSKAAIITDDVTASSNVNVTGNVVVSKAAIITGDVTASSNVDVTGNVNVTKNVDITGTLTVDSTANIGGNSNITGTLDITGDTTLYDASLKLSASNGNVLSLNVDPSIAGNYTIKLPAALGSVGHVIKVADTTGNLEFAAETGGGSSALDDISAGDAESTLTTTTGKIIINPQANDLEMNVPTANKISLQVNSGEKMFVDTNSANIAVATGITSSLDVSGDITASSNVDVTGNVNVTKNVDITGTLTVDSTANIGGNSNITGTLDITGATTIYDNLTVEGDLNTSNTFSLDQGAITVSGGTVTEVLDFSQRSDFIISVSGTSTLTLASKNVNTVGQQGSIIITQTADTNSLSWQTSNGWYFPSATAPTLSSGTGYYDIFSYLVVASGGSKKILVMDATNFQAY